jgi:mannobiose 2-epimerase
LKVERIVLLLLLSSGLCVAQAPSPSPAISQPPTRETYLKLAVEVEDALHSDVINVWFPRSVDMKNGGFHSHFVRDWQSEPSDGKFSVFQGRMTWVASQVVLRDPKRKEEFLPIVRHDVDYLQDVMWDKQDGGFFWGLDDAGKVTPDFTDGKHLYGISFCIYGAAAAPRQTAHQSHKTMAQSGKVPITIAGHSGM